MGRSMKWNPLKDWPFMQQPTEKILWRLRKALQNEKRRQLHELNCAPPLAEISALTKVFVLASYAEDALSDKAFDSDPQAAVQVVRELEETFTETLWNESIRQTFARQALANVMQKLAEASKCLGRLVLPVIVNIRRALLPVDLLHQVRMSLFPAERMMVMAGQRMGPVVRLGAVFDVTGERHSMHVNADPQKLSRALIAMTKSDTYFACWWHSHPGTGAGATGFSQEDVEQYAGLVEHYSKNLLGVIMVEDGWFRFWGTAIESGMIDVEFIGKGIIRRNAHEHVYSFEE